MAKPHFWLIAIVSRLVPRRLRADWTREWIGELDHRERVISRWPRDGAAIRWHLFRRSLGAFRDALWLQPRRLEEDCVQDVRYGARLLLQHKTWTAVAVLTLALGIGANTALFSVADDVLMKTLPVRNPHELVLLTWTSGPRLMGAGFSPGISIDPVTGASAGRSFSYLAFDRFRRESRALSDVFAFTTLFRDPPTNENPQPPIGQMVSGSYHRALGVPAVLGRTLTDADDADGAPQVAVISDRFWKNRYGRDRAVIGRSIATAGGLFTIVGVTPPGFDGTQDVGDSADVTIAFGAAVPPTGAIPKFVPRMKVQPWVWTLMVMGRLGPGRTRSDAGAELQPILQAAAAEGWRASGRAKSGSTRDAPVLHVETGAKGLTDIRRALSRSVWIMTGVVTLVLLIVCANLVNLLLARAAARQREIATRLALGASRARLVRQFLVEALLLAACAAAAGAVIASWTKDAFLAWLVRVSPAIAIEPRIDVRAALFASIAAVVIGLAVGIVPAFAATRVDVNAIIAGGSRSDRRPRSFISRGLLVGQVAMSVVLLVAAGLFVRTLVNLQSADVGFNMRNLLTFKATPRPDKHPRAQLASLYERILARVQTTPGVVAATSSRYPLLGGDFAMPFIVVPGRIRPDGEDSTVYEQGVWDNFFETMQLTLVRGRVLTARDRADRRLHVVINEALARKYFPGIDPIGRRIAVTKDPGAQSAPEDALMEIVGVARDAKYTTVRQAPPTTIFEPFSPGAATFEVRTAGDPRALADSIRASVRSVDADLLLTGFRTLDEQAELTYARERHFAILSSTFGALALALACIGLYGVMAYNVAHRTREIGIRMALGAERAAIVRFIMRDMLSLVAAGAVLGLIAASALTRTISSMLFGLSTVDGPTIAVSVGLLFAVAALAAYLPARRAAIVNPVAALRADT